MSELQCEECGATEGLHRVGGGVLCEDCMKKIEDQFVEAWDKRKTKKRREG